MNVAVAPAGVDLDVADASIVTRADADLVVAVGADGVRSLLDDVPAVPVLVVDDCQGVPSADVESLDQVLAQVRDDHYETVTRPVLSVTSGDRKPASAFFDVSVVTTAPAKISEFRIAVGDEPVTTVRADGFVLSTPAGSLGYNRDVDGALLDPRASVLAAVPIAPFVTDPDQYVLDDSDVTLTVVRDETDVTLYCDGDVVGPVEPHVPVHVTADRAITFVETASTTVRFDG